MNKKELIQQDYEWYLTTPQGDVLFDDVNYIDLNTLMPVMI